VCFSARADVVAGGAVLVIGVDVLRQVHQPQERALAALPVLLGAHQVTEALVWWGLTDKVAWSTGRTATWLYLVVALAVLPVLVPMAMVRVRMA